MEDAIIKTNDNKQEISNDSSISNEFETTIHYLAKLQFEIKKTELLKKRKENLLNAYICGISQLPLETPIINLQGHSYSKQEYQTQIKHVQDTNEAREKANKVPNASQIQLIEFRDPRTNKVTTEAYFSNTYYANLMSFVDNEKYITKDQLLDALKKENLPQTPVLITKGNNKYKTGAIADEEIIKKEKENDPMVTYVKDYASQALLDEWDKQAKNFEIEKNEFINTTITNLRSGGDKEIIKKLTPATVIETKIEIQEKNKNYIFSRSLIKTFKDLHKNLNPNNANQNEAQPLVITDYSNLRNRLEEIIKKAEKLEATSHLVDDTKNCKDILQELQKLKNDINHNQKRSKNRELDPYLKTVNTIKYKILDNLKRSQEVIYKALEKEKDEHKSEEVGKLEKAIIKRFVLSGACFIGFPVAWGLSPIAFILDIARCCCVNDCNPANTSWGWKLLGAPISGVTFFQKALKANKELEKIHTEQEYFIATKN